LFTGIIDGKSDCDNKPLLRANERKEEAYFDAFFSDKGDYSTFINTEIQKKMQTS
jgi:hypothetical protein